MRIAIACGSFRVMGGRERDCLAIASGLAARGHDVTLVTAYPPARAPEGVTMRRIHPRGMFNHGRAWGFSRAFAIWRRRHPVDLSLGFDRMEELDFFYCADQPRRRYRGLKRFLPRNMVYAKLEAAVFGPSSSTHVFFLAEAQIANYRAAYDLPEHRYALLPLTLKQHHKAPAQFYASRQRLRSQLDVPPDAILLINVAAYGRQKGVDRVIEAMGAVPSALFLSVGMDDAAEFRAAARKLGVAPRVRFVAQSDDIAGLIGAADIMVHPARAETTGNVIIESLLYGVPVICTSVCGYSVHVARSDAGIVLHEPYRQQSLVQALALAVEPDALAQLRAAARRASALLAAAPGMDALVAQIEAAMQSRLRGRA